MELLKYRFLMVLLHVLAFAAQGLSNIYVRADVVGQSVMPQNAFAISNNSIMGNPSLHIPPISYQILNPMNSWQSVP